MNQDQLELLNKALDADYAPHLPRLLQPKTEAENVVKNRSRSYAAFALCKILSLDRITGSKSVIDDYDDNGIDAIFYQQNEKAIYILQGKLKRSETFRLEDAQNFIDGVRDFVNQNFGRFNRNVQEKKAELEFALEDADQIILVIAHLSDGVTKHAKDQIDHFLNKEAKEIDGRLQPDWIDFGGGNALEELLGEQAASPVHASLYIYGDKAVSGTYNTYYGQVSLKALADLYDKHRNDLFEKNIRYFLGIARSDVNRAINRTLETEPQNFFYLNNGVTALAKKIHPKGQRDGKRLYKLNYFSIINGAQTIASSHHFLSTHPEIKIDDAKVMITLIEVDNDITFGVKITKARNHQNTVSTAHFAALDPEQERIRRELALLHINYRYRPEAVTASSEEIINIDEAAIALALFHPDPSIPVLLKQELSSFTNPETSNYKKVFTNTLSGKRLANAVRLYRSANNSLASNEAASINGSQEKLIYRHGRYVTIWLTFNANISWLNRNNIMSAEDANVTLSRPLDEWKELVRFETYPELAHAYKGPLAFFRNRTNTIPFVIRLRDRGLVPHQNIVV